jgi:acyl carrier protein
MEDKIVKIINSIIPEFDFSLSDFTEALDSFDLILLTAELEKTFNIRIGGEDVTKDNFKNIKNIVKLINKSK